jgi:hypothetical protein
MVGTRRPERNAGGRTVAAGSRSYCLCVPGTPTVESACTTFTWRGLVSAFFGRKMRRTPSRVCAVTFPASTVRGKVNLLAKAP